MSQRRAEGEQFAPIFMNINWRGKDWPPVYFDPEFDEIIELTKSFDTLRIGLKLEKGRYHLVIASGLGNTHSTLSRALGELNPRLKVSRIDGLKYDGLDGCAILYEEDNRIWFNMDSIGEGEKVSPYDAIKQFPSEIRQMIKDIVRLSEERLNQL